MARLSHRRRDVGNAFPEGPEAGNELPVGRQRGIELCQDAIGPGLTLGEELVMRS